MGFFAILRYGLANFLDQIIVFLVDKFLIDGLPDRTQRIVNYIIVFYSQNCLIINRSPVFNQSIYIQTLQGILALPELGLKQTKFCVFYHLLSFGTYSYIFAIYVMYALLLYFTYRDLLETPLIINNL